MITIYPMNAIPTHTEVLAFLVAFQAKRTESGLIFLEREKNVQGLLDLEITAKRRTRVITQLKPEDYYRGPREDSVNLGAAYWEFGKVVKKREVYIKLSLGLAGQPARCMSFHPAERDITYPLKKLHN